MANEYKINIHRTEISWKEFIESVQSKGHWNTNVLGIDWCLSIKTVRKLEFKNLKSLRNVSLFSHRIRVTLQYSDLKRKMSATVRVLCHPEPIRAAISKPTSELQRLCDNFKGSLDFYFDCEKGNSSVSSEVEFEPATELYNSNLNGINSNVYVEFTLYVNSQNYFYFMFSDDTSKLVDSVTASSRNILTEVTGDLNDLFQKQDFADVEIKCGDKVFKAHKIILSARSPVFAAMFQHEMKENVENMVEIKDMDSSVLKLLLEFIYSGKLDGLNSHTVAGELLSAAEQYQLAGLKKACLSYLHCAMSIDNALSTLSLADLHDVALKKITIDFVCKEFDDLRNTEEWEIFQKDKPVLANQILLNIIGFAAEHGYKPC